MIGHISGQDKGDDERTECSIFVAVHARPNVVTFVT